MSDILDSIAEIRLAFLRQNMEPPAAIHLKTHEEGIRFLSALRLQDQWVATSADGGMGYPRKMADGAFYMEVEAMGIKIRWPASRRATADGSWAFV